MNQKKASKVCDCGRGRIYTGDNSVYNAKVAGKQVCPECFLDEIKNMPRRSALIKDY